MLGPPLLFAALLQPATDREPQTPTSVAWPEAPPESIPKLDPAPGPPPAQAREPTATTTSPDDANEELDANDQTFELPPDLSVQAGKNIVVTPGGILQLRYTANRREQTPERSLTTGFAVPRGRVSLDVEFANMFRVYVRAGANAGGSFSLERAFGDFNYKNLVRIRGGQFYLQPFAEGNVSPDKLLTADFSALNNAFEPGASQGVELSVTPANWRVSGAVTDGLRTGFSEVLSSLTADVAVTGHVEVSLLEQGWARFDDFTSFRNSNAAIRLGLGAHYQTGGRTGRTADLDLAYVAADAQFEGNGWNAFVQGVYARTRWGDDVDPEYVDAVLHDWGALAQAGVFVANPLELFAQGSFVHSDREDRPDAPDIDTPIWFRTATAGVNLYPLGSSHFAKLTGDFTYMFDPLVDTLVPVALNSGMLETFAGDQWALRLQWVLSF